MYELNIDPETNKEIPNTVKRTSDGFIINFDITIPEYREYLSWCFEQSKTDEEIIANI